MLRLDLVQIVLVEIVTLLWCVLLSFLNLLFRSHVLFTKLLWDTKYWQILFSCPEVSMLYIATHRRYTSTVPPLMLCALLCVVLCAFAPWPRAL